MTMLQAIGSAFVRWCAFSGRAGGTEYWWFVLFGTIVFGLASLLDHAAFGRHALFWATCTLVFLMPYVAVAIRRIGRAASQPHAEAGAVAAIYVTPHPAVPATLPKPFRESNNRRTTLSAFPPD